MLEVGTNAPTTPNNRTKTFKKEFMIAVLLTFLGSYKRPCINMIKYDRCFTCSGGEPQQGDVESCWSLAPDGC